MLKLLCLVPFILCKKFIVVSKIPHDSREFITENTVLLGNLRYDFLEHDSVMLSENIVSIEEDLPVNIDGYKMQKDPIWNLDRIDQRSNDLNSMYFYQDLAGTGVWNYVLDTGIWVDHKEFEGRAEWGLNVADDQTKDGCMHPHGTHVAGTIGGKTFGIAKNTSLVSVKVLDCSGSGSTSGIVKALGWVASQNKKKKVINMSLGGGFSNALNSAVEQITKAGVVVVVAAGNENSDACGGSPSSSQHAITVGATDRRTNIAGFSNWGKCVDIFAPGVDVLSAVPNGGTSSMSGTSMASPHIAGVVSLILDAYSEDKVDVAKIEEFLKFSSSKGKISGDLKNSPNELGFSLASFVI